MNSKELSAPFDRFDFGVCLREDGERSFFRVPIQPAVEVVFQNSLSNTLVKLQAGSGGGIDDLTEYDPAAIHKTIEPCVLDPRDDCNGKLKSMLELQDLETNSSVLRDNSDKVFFYFCRFKKGDRYIWGIRKANQFKSSLKTKAAFLSGDTLGLAPDKVFRLDDFFDVVLTNEKILILRPNDFEYLADLEEELATTASVKLREADQKLPFLDLEPLAVEMEKGGSIRRARVATSVARRPDLEKTDRNLFAKACEMAGIPLEEREGKLHAKNGNGWEIIAVLDRRRFWTDLIQGEHEIYETPNRHRV